MKKCISVLLVLTLFIVSCKQVNTFGIKQIELRYHQHETVLITDKVVISRIATYIENASGEKELRTEIPIALSYDLILHYDDETTTTFVLIDQWHYMKYIDNDDDDFNYIYADDMQSMWEYLYPKYPILQKDR